MLCQDIKEILYVKFDGCASVGIAFHEIGMVNIIVNGSTDAQMQVLINGWTKKPSMFHPASRCDNKIIWFAVSQQTQCFAPHQRVHWPVF